MKAFKIHNIEKVKQEVNLPAGTYTYSCRVIPVGTSYTFRLDNQSFTFEGLTAGVLNKRMKHTFELTEAVSFFYLSNTIGDCVYEPQIEEGVFATTPGAHPLDFERLISEAGIEIDHEALSLYAKKADVSAEIKIETDRIDSTVGNISNDVDEVKGDITTISQTVNSITSTVTNHTTQISTFQQTVNQIYASIEDVGSGEFSYILQRIDEIEIKVGAPGQKGSIQLALDSIALTVYDKNEGMSAIVQKVDSITSTVRDKHGALLSQISQDGSNILIQGTQIDLRGATTINDNFKVLMDGSIETKNAIIRGQLTNPFTTTLLTTGSSTKYIDVTKYGSFYVPTMPNGSNNGWYYTWLPTESKYNGLTLNFMWNPINAGMHWRIYCAGGDIYREDMKQSFIDFTSDTKRFIQLMGFWNSGLGRLDWVVVRNIKVGDGVEDRAEAGEVLSVAEINLNGNLVTNNSKYYFSVGSYRDSTGVYQISINKTPHNPLTSSNYTPLIIPLAEGVMAGVSNITSTTFKVHTKGASTPINTPFRIVLVANTKLDFRNQYGL